jgi:hypothetical protein
MLFCEKEPESPISGFCGCDRKGRGEQGETKFGQKTRAQSFTGCRGGGEGEDGTAAAAHERIEHFGLLAKPAFGRRQPRVFREGGRFEVVAESEIGEGAAWHTLLRILRIGFVGPGRRDAKAGVDEQALVSLPELHGFDDFAASAADRRLPVDEKGDVAPQARREFGELAVGAIDPGQLAQREQHGRRIAAAPAESGADRHMFFKMDADAGGQLELIKKKSRGPGGEIVMGVGERGVGAGEPDALGNEIDFERVAEGNRRHERFKFVEAVGTAAHNVEIEIDFGVSKLFHCVKVNLQPR